MELHGTYYWWDCAPVKGFNNVNSCVLLENQVLIDWIDAKEDDLFMKLKCSSTDGFVYKGHAVYPDGEKADVVLRHYLNGAKHAFAGEWRTDDGGEGTYLFELEV